MKKHFLRSLILSGLFAFVTTTSMAQGVIFSKEQIEKIENINNTSSESWQPPLRPLDAQPLVENGQKPAQEGVIENSFIEKPTDQPMNQQNQKPVEEKKTGALPWLRSKFGDSSKEKKVEKEARPLIQENDDQYQPKDPISESNTPTIQPKTPLENKENLEKLINQNKVEEPKKELEKPQKQQPVYNYKTSNEAGGKLVLEFTEDDQSLNQDQRLLISALIDKLLNSPEIRIVIESYAGKQELESYARKIALKRALEVRKIIKGADIDKKRIILKVIDYKPDSTNANKIFVREL